MCITLKYRYENSCDTNALEQHRYKEPKLSQEGGGESSKTDDFYEEEEDDDLLVELMDEEDLDVIDSAPNFDPICVPGDSTSSSNDDDDEDDSERLRLTYFAQADLDASSCPLILETVELDVMMPPQSRMIQAPALTFIIRDGGPKGAMMCSATVNLWDHADAIYDARPVDISDLVVILPEFMKQYVVLEPLFHPSLTHSTYSCVTYTKSDHSPNSKRSSRILFSYTFTHKLEYYEILNSRFALEHRY